MPEFETVPVQEAKLMTLSNRQRQFMNEHIGYIQQLPKGQAGRLHVLAYENLLTIRRWLVTAAKALGTPLTIKRSGSDVYFWHEGGKDQQPRPRRPRRGRAGGLLPPDMLIVEPDVGEQGVREEESPELGQTDQVVTDAMRRVDPE